MTGTSDLRWRFSSSSRTEVSNAAEFKLREGTASDSRAAFDVEPYLRATIATNYVRALARYYGAGTAARFAMFSMTGQPKRTAHGHEALRIGAADSGEFAQLDLAAQ